MAFQYYEFKEDEKREYTPTIWSYVGKKIIPEGGIVDIENDFRLIPYGNGPAMEPCDEFQFIFDYKGTAMNINIEEKVIENDVYYTLLNIKVIDSLNRDKILPALREAIIFWAKEQWNMFGEDNTDFIHIEF